MCATAYKLTKQNPAAYVPGTPTLGLYQPRALGTVASLLLQGLRSAGNCPAPAPIYPPAKVSPIDGVNRVAARRTAAALSSNHTITGWFTNTWNVSELEQTGAAEDKTVVTMTGGAAAALTCQAGHLLT